MIWYQFRYKHHRMIQNLYMCAYLLPLLHEKHTKAKDKRRKEGEKKKKMMGAVIFFHEFFFFFNASKLPFSPF